MRDNPVELLNFVVNQPEVLQEVAPGYESVDLSQFFTKPENKWFGDDTGVVIFGYRGRDIYEMHYLFSGAAHGQKALRTVQEAFTKMFTEHGAVAIVGATPRDNLPARMMNRALGGRPVGENTDASGRPCIIYKLERKSWATSLAALSAALDRCSVEARPQSKT